LLVAIFVAFFVDLNFAIEFGQLLIFTHESSYCFSAS